MKRVGLFVVCGITSQQVLSKLVIESTFQPQKPIFCCIQVITVIECPSPSVFQLFYPIRRESVFKQCALFTGFKQ